MRKNTIYNNTSKQRLTSVCPSASVDAKISPIEMMIGEQSQVKDFCPIDEQAKVQFPTFKPRQELVPGVECWILKSYRSSADTNN